MRTVSDRRGPAAVRQERGPDTFLSKIKAKTVDAKLAKWTKWVAIAFMLLTLSLSLIP